MEQAEELSIKGADVDLLPIRWPGGIFPCRPLPDKDKGLNLERQSQRHLFLNGHVKKCVVL